MKYIKRHLLMMKEMIDDMLAKLEDRSFWRESSLPSRIREAEAIESMGKTLVKLVKSRDIVILGSNNDRKKQHY